MPRNAENAILKMESGQTAHAMAALTDSGDHQIFDSGVEMWSGAAGYEPSVKPNGLATGGILSVNTGTNNSVKCAALTVYIGGTLLSVAANNALTCARGTTNGCRIHSITTDGSTISVTSGTESTAFSDTRGAAGGPPLIGVDLVEIGQVRLSSTTAAEVAADEIKQVIGTHQERYDYPTHQIDSDAGKVTFASALPAVHTGPTAKKIFASYYEPEFAEITNSAEAVMPETSHSTASKQIYGGTIGSSSSTLGQGSFRAYLEDGVADPLIAAKNDTRWFLLFPNRYNGNHLRCQGKLGIKREFPAGDTIVASCTISATSPATEVVA